MFDCDSALDIAVEKDYLDIVQLLHGRVSMSEHHAQIKFAAICGYIDIIQWLFQHLPEEYVSPDEVQEAGAQVADARTAMSVCLKVVQLLHEFRGEGDGIRYYTSEAKLNGQFEIVKWLTENSAPIIGSRDMDEAAAMGHLDMLIWLHENCRLGFDIFKWLHANRNEGCSARAMDGTAGNGHLHVIKRLHENRSEGCMTRAMDDAAKNNHTNMAKWLHVNRKEGCTTRAIDGAAPVEMVEWLHNNRSEGCTTEAMDNAANREDADTLHFLHANRTEGCTIGAGESAHFEGHTVIFYWLVDNYPSVMDPENVDDEEDEDFKAFFLRTRIESSAGGSTNAVQFGDGFPVASTPVARDPHVLLVEIEDRVERLEEVVAEHPPVEPLAEITNVQLNHNHMPQTCQYEKIKVGEIGNREIALHVVAELDLAA